MTLAEAPVSSLKVTVDLLGPTNTSAYACSVSLVLLLPCVTASINKSSLSVLLCESISLTVCTPLLCFERHTFAK